MWAGITAFFTALPELIDLFKKALNGFIDFVEAQKAEALSQRERTASEKATSTKDTSDLEGIFKGKA